MKTENEFNALMSSKLRTMWGMTEDCIFHMKPNDRITDGISDFIIWFQGKTLAMENKFIKDIKDGSKAQVLQHVFSGAQLSFLRSQRYAGNRAMGLVAVDAHKCFYIFELSEIPESGNWKSDEFLDIISTKERFTTNEDGFKRMINYVFGRLL